MSFELNEVVPWGRNFNEYKQMFNLSEADLNKKICSFGDGPASFNAEMHSINKTVTSIDPLYQYSKVQIIERIKQTKETVIQQTKNNNSNFIWKNIGDIDTLEKIRIEAMYKFINDFENGLKEGRYINHAMPSKTDFKNCQFDLGLSSHFLILYSQLGIAFHIQSITEMLRICKEIRIFPLLNLNAVHSEVLDGIIQYFQKEYSIQIVPVSYEFQRGANKMLVIKNL